MATSWSKVLTQNPTTRGQEMKRTIALVVALLALAAVNPLRAATPAGGILTPDQQTLTWAGTFAGGLPPSAPEASCNAGLCDSFDLTLALGESYWDTHPGDNVEVAIRWTYDGVTDLDVVVVDSYGTEVGRSAAVDSNTESVFLREPIDGRYRVDVAPTTTLDPEGGSDFIRYQGLAQIEPNRFDASAAPTDLLPDLIAYPPARMQVATAGGLLPQPRNPFVSCYPEETIENPAHPTRCLRFDQTIGNVGTGPLELRFRMEGAASTDPQDQKMIQRIYNARGEHRDRFAESYELHPAHGHVHYAGFGQSFLYRYDWATGRAERASAGKKVGFCVIDVLLIDEYWGRTGNGPRSKTFPTCDVPTESDASGTWLVQGVDVGWADLYGWNLPDQYIDVTNVPNGLYELEQVANPSGSVIEITDANNKASTIICLSGNAVTEVRTAEEAAECTSPTT